MSEKDAQYSHPLQYTTYEDVWTDGQEHFLIPSQEHDQVSKLLLLLSIFFLIFVL